MSERGAFGTLAIAGWLAVLLVAGGNLAANGYAMFRLAWLQLTAFTDLPCRLAAWPPGCGSIAVQLGLDLVLIVAYALAFAASARWLEARVRCHWVLGMLVAFDLFENSSTVLALSCAPGTCSFSCLAGGFTSGFAGLKFVALAWLLVLLLQAWWTRTGRR